MRIGHRLRNLFLAGTVALVAGALTAATAAPHGGAVPSITEQTLYSFCPQGTCPDGRGPAAGLIMDTAGNLYGTTASGGTGTIWAGTVFQLTPTGAGWSEKTLYSFCSRGGTACTDGATPLAPLIMDAAGNLYGTTEFGGTGCDIVSNCGTVFELTPTGTGWSEKVIYTFCSQGGTGCTDGAYPLAPLIMDAAGNLYGTTSRGGTGTGCRLTIHCGAVFELTPTGTGWSEKVIYSFCSQSNCTDGSPPEAGLIMDAAGNLYGTTNTGGASYYYGGTVFQLTPTGTG